MENEYDIIIIGAGAAGLMAAVELAEAGKKILILEARERIGGRIHTIRHEGIILEAGAEFVHGDLPLTLGLLKKAHIEYHHIGGKMEQSKNGKWMEEEEFIEGWDELMQKMSNLQNDMVLADFLQVYFKEDKYNNLRNSVVRYAQGFDLADENKASTLELYNEWSNEDHNQYRIRGGYGALIDYLSEKCQRKACVILTDHVVNEIQWEKNKADVITTTKKTFTAKKILVTIPLPLLQGQNKKGTIIFNPSIDKQIEFLRQIGFGSVVKILMIFKNAFWQKNKIGFIISDQAVPTWWSQEPEKNNLLTGWLGVPPAKESSVKTDNEISQTALQSLSSIFNLKMDFLKSTLEVSHIFNWNDEAFAEGAYSYALPGTAEARKKLKEPVEGTLFFAGEALYDGDSLGTVEAALTSGRETAKKVLSYF